MELARLHEMKVMELKTQQETKMMEKAKDMVMKKFDVMRTLLLSFAFILGMMILSNTFNPFQSLLKDLVLGYSQVKSSPIVKAFLATSFASSLSTLLSNLVGAIVVAKGLLAR
jgi:K+/H+ antiporter YhaU regulatory subunit KhtT